LGGDGSAAESEETGTQKESANGLVRKVVK